jgi:DNA-binding transcriptional MerR regulator
MAQATDQLISITELGEIVTRKINTIRKWEREGRLPKHLIPRRGDNGRRFWTHEQVYGQRGIIKWMERNDMRPGKYLAKPENQVRHVKALRRPKYLSKRLVILAQTMARNKATVDEILDEIYPHTPQYAARANLEIALRRYFKAQGWYFPKREPVRRPRGPQKPRNLERDLKIINMHDILKIKPPEIAKEFGISEARVKEIIRTFQAQ